MQTMHTNAGPIEDLILIRLMARQQSIRVQTMDHFYVVSLVCQKIGQALNKNRIAPEAVGRIEGCD